MNDYTTRIANDLANYLSANETCFTVSPENRSIVHLDMKNQETTSLDLSPFCGELHSANAESIFSGVITAEDLMNAYRYALDCFLLEDSIPGAITHVDLFSFTHINHLVDEGISDISDQEAQRIAKWLQSLDIYSALKSLESLLNNKADRVMLEVAEEQGWSLIFDHLAIRCGSEKRGDARRIVDFLCSKYGYSPAISVAEQHYRFAEGWDAYLLYKQLNNGLLLRLFVDESSKGHDKQIIQYWNWVYGYTAHHLAVRAIKKSHSNWKSVPLSEFISAMTDKGVKSLAPTGSYTQGLLEQVFTQPSLVLIPEYIEKELQVIDPDLSRLVRNGKLIELVSRREMPLEFVERLYLVHGIEFEADNPLHTSPMYTYFLPAQAAHVIRTSVQQ